MKKLLDIVLKYYKENRLDIINSNGINLNYPSDCCWTLLFDDEELTEIVENYFLSDTFNDEKLIETLNSMNWPNCLFYGDYPSDFIAAHKAHELLVNFIILKELLGEFDE